MNLLPLAINICSPVPLANVGAVVSVCGPDFLLYLALLAVVGGREEKQKKEKACGCRCGIHDSTSSFCHFQ